MHKYRRVPSVLEYWHNVGQSVQFVYIGLPTFDSRCFQFRNFSSTLSRFTLDIKNSSVLIWCHPFYHSISKQALSYGYICFFNTQVLSSVIITSLCVYSSVSEA